MTRVHIICEGQTEETFVNQVLAPYLNRIKVYPIPSLVGKPGKKGGNITTQRMTDDIKLRLLNDSAAYCTTFFDYYGLDKHFVGKRNASSHHNIEKKADEIENALRKRVEEMAGDTAAQRFIPYIQMYEFEGLLFSDPIKLSRGLYEPNLATDFARIRNDFPTPEDINNSKLTAPSKRLLALMPSYEKPLFGSLAALEIGLETIRRECRRFENWMTALESLSDKP